MISSMTAFARQHHTYPWGSLTWEVRSVNHRYLEPSLRLPENLRELEGPGREQIRGQLQRGKVDATLTLHTQSSDQSLSINESQLQQLLSVAHKIEERLNNPARMSAMEVLAWPGVLDEADLDMEQVKQAALTLLQQSLVALKQTRQREGEQMQNFMQQRLQQMSEHVALIEQRMPKVGQLQRERLQTKLDELKAEPDPERFEQELVYWAQKTDTAEELSRLGVHIQEVQRILNKGGTVGRRLDFLMQELNRETNTIAAKSIDAEVTQTAVEMKVLIEQMREQVQNIE